MNELLKNFRLFYKERLRALRERTNNFCLANAIFCPKVYRVCGRYLEEYIIKLNNGIVHHLYIEKCEMPKNLPFNIYLPIHEGPFTDIEMLEDLRKAAQQ